jgi:hypothetical protein
MARTSPMRRCALLAMMVLGPGCSGPLADEDRPRLIDPAALVPVKGVITVNGQPLSKLVITFLPRTGAPAVGETNKEGKYQLATATRPGILPGDYTVAISYLVSADGEPQGLGPRSAIAQPRGMLTAKEALPAEYADLGRSTLKRTVNPQGGSFDFDVKADLELPKAKTEGGKAEGKPNSEGKKAETPPGAKDDEKSGVATESSPDRGA